MANQWIPKVGNRVTVLYMDAGSGTIMYDNEKPPSRYRVDLDDGDYGWYPIEDLQLISDTKDN